MDKGLSFNGSSVPNTGSNRFRQSKVLLIALIICGVLGITDLAQVAHAQVGPAFVGVSPPVTDSRGSLFFKEDLANEQVFCWNSSDTILGDINTGFVTTTQWRLIGSGPTRLIFRGSGDGATFYGNVLFEPYNRVVVDVVKNQKRVRYLLTPKRGSFPRLSFGGKFRRVDIHGLPMPDRSPTGEGEDDRLSNMAYIDMYDLAPCYSVTDVAVPVEGGELTLEFRRTSGIRRFRHSTDVRKQGITYPSDFILGLGWDTNMNSRIIVAFDPDEGSCTQGPATTARVTDEVGNFYQYLDIGQTGEENPFPANVYHSFSDDAVRAKLFRQDADTLVLVKLFGTRLTYEKIGRFTPPSATNWEDYYRLASVEDRNGNKLVYVYNEGERTSFLVAKIHEQGHPERKILFEYALGTGTNGVDRGDRLTRVTDPLGRETTFTFGQSGGKPWKLLLEIKREPVADGENPGAVVQPTVTFGYHAVELPVEETQFPPFLANEDFTTRNRFVGLSSITDARGHETRFSYKTEFFPSSIATGGIATFYQKRIRLTGASTVDGNVVLEQDERTPQLVITRVKDTRGNKVEYRFDASLVPENNKIGVALYVTKLTRTTEALQANNTAIFEWTPDRFANLTDVTDMNGNTIDYEYGNLAAQQSNQPTSRTITDTGSGKTITTTYEYGIFNKMTRMVDGEGKITEHALDANGNRTAVIEAAGTLNKTTQYTHAPDGFIIKITDPDGRVTVFSRSFNVADLNRQYTVTFNVTGYNAELNLDTETVYDVMGNEVEMTDPEENVYMHEYDNLYRRTRTINPPVEVIPGGPLESSENTYTYTLNGSVVDGRDDEGNVTVNVYDLMNRVSQTRRRMADPNANDDVADLTIANTYNPVGLVERTTDPNGNITEFAYDALLRLTQKTVDADVLAFTERYLYGANAGSGAFVYTDGWQSTRITNRRGFSTDNIYDGFYRLTETVRRGTGQPEPTIQYTYDKVHNELSRTVLAEAGAGSDRTMLTEYDDLDRPVRSILKEVGGDDYVTVMAYDLSGNVEQVIDREGNTSDTVYDGNNRVIKVEQPAVNGGRPTTITEYDDNGNKTKVTDPNGNQVAMNYDARNRLSRTILDLNGDGAFDPSHGGPDIVTDTHYDLVDNLVRAVDPNGNATDTEYDRAYRTTLVAVPAVADAENGGVLTRPATFTDYDKNGNVIRRTDPRGVETFKSYDGLDRVVSVTKADGSVDEVTTTTIYDENDNVLELTLDNGASGLQITSYTYDLFDRQTTETWPGGNLTTTAYYRNNLLQAVIDPKGQRIENEYDKADRINQSTHKRADGTPEEVRQFTYDRMDNVQIAQDLNGTTIYIYDALYRALQEERADFGQKPFTVTSQYDLNSNRTRVTYPDDSGAAGAGRALESAYDRADRLVNVTDSIGGKTTTYVYDANGNRTEMTLPNGVTEEFSYDSLNRVLSHVSANGGVSIYSAAYEYDLADNRRSITETMQGQSTRNLVYDYDDQYRLTSESWQGNLYDYTYDPAGNRLTKCFNGTITDYAYNERNELETEISGGITISHDYDDNGNRIRKTVSGGSTIDYVWDVNDRLVRSEVGGISVFAASYDYRTRRLTKTEGSGETYFRYDGGVSFQELVSETSNLNVEFVRGSGMGGGIGSILYSDQSAANGGDEFFCYNAVGHTVALTNSGADVLKTDLYEAFGNIVSSSGTSANNRLSNTKERDFSIGLDNHGTRYYDPGAGRYISRDPSGYSDGPNVYIYVYDNPTNHIDPLGLGFGSWLKAKARAAASMTARAAKAVGRGVKGAVESTVTAVSEVAQGLATAEGRQACVEALEGSRTILADTFTFHAIDSLHAKAETYQGADYDASRFLFTGSRELLLAAGTAGIGKAAQAGVKGAQIAQKGILLYEVGSGGWDVGSAIDLASQGQYKEAGLKGFSGVLRAGGAFLNARAINASAGEFASKKTPQVLKNKAKGDAFRDEIADLMQKEGLDVQKEVVKKTPFGKRVIDIEVSKGGKVLGGIETKAGKSRYLPSQRSKDKWLQLFKDYPVNVVRDQ